MITNISVTSNIVAVPYENAAFYFDKEIKSEGKWRNEAEVITMQPSDKIDTEIIKNTSWVFEQMEKVRLNPAFNFMEINGMSVDIGLLDIQVFFKGNQEQVITLLEQDRSSLFLENCRHLDSLSNGNIHDQMFLMNTLHLYDTKGELAFHYHNVIFGIRVQNGLVGELNLEPLLSSFLQKKSINVVSSVC